MTQQPLNWLIRAPQGGPSFNDLLVLACRGNEKIATLLYNLLYEGMIIANRRNLKRDQIEYVRLNINLDDIVQGLKRLHKSASKQSIIEWRKSLREWGFLQFDGHRQTYDLYFHKVEEAMKSPPPKEITPRGRHATRKKIQDSSLETPNSSLDNERFKLGDSGDSSLEGRDSSLDNKGEIQLLRSHVSKLESHISKVESEMLKLESLISHERACRAELEAKVDALYNLSTINGGYNLEERKKEAFPEDTQPPPSSLSLSSDSHDEIQGGVTLPPASDKGVSTSSASGELSSSSGGDSGIPNLDPNSSQNSQNSPQSPSISQGDTQPPLQPGDTGLPIVSNGVGPAMTQESSGAQGYTKSRTAGGSCVQLTQEQTLAKPHSDALVSVARSKNPLLAQLTELQSTFWLRWCAKSQTAFESLNSTAYGHIVDWSSDVETQQDMDELYDIADRRIRALTAANSQPYVPPRLGNLKNALGDWKVAKAQKEKARQAPAQRTVSGSGTIMNHTIVGTYRDAPKLDYSYAVVASASNRRQSKPQIQGVSGMAIDTAAMLKQYEQRRKAVAT